MGRDPVLAAFPLRPEGELRIYPDAIEAPRHGSIRVSEITRAEARADRLVIRRGDEELAVGLLEGDDAERAAATLHKLLAETEGGGEEVEGVSEGHEGAMGGAVLEEDVPPTVE